jgi:hypothetical protein
MQEYTHALAFLFDVFALLYSKMKKRLEKETFILYNV